MAPIFISYRREDEPFAATLIWERLKAAFGPDGVFIDVEGLPPGLDVREQLAIQLQNCVVMVAVIGSRWHGKSIKDSRLRDADDYVRLELETALERNIPVIPVPVGKGRMPKRRELPESLYEIVGRNSREIQPGPTYTGQMNRLIEGVGFLLQRPRGVRKSPPTLDDLPPFDPEKEGRRKEWMLYQVAFLWHGKEAPPLAAHFDLMPPEVARTKQELHAAVDHGELLLSHEYRTATGVTRFLARPELTRYARSRGASPEFLFTDRSAEAS